jgi:ribosomal protein S18 acetylase RimI-like enzyme
MTIDLPVAFRAYRDEDEPFIFDTWIRSFEHQNDYAGPYTSKQVRAAIRGTIEDILTAGASVTVACDPEDPDLIVGYVVFETKYEFPVIHYVYVKEGAREAGLGRALIDRACQGHADRARYTFRTRAAQSLLPRGKWKPRRNRHLS